MSAQILLNNVNTGTISDTFFSTGGPAIVNVRGDNFSGVTVLIEVSSANDPNQRWATLENGLFDAGQSRTIDYLPAGLRLRASASGVSAGNNIFVDIIQ